MGQVDKNAITDIPYMTVYMGYETLGGSGCCKYRFPIRAGRIPFSEMECVHLDCLPPTGCFEITDVTEDSVSFIVPGGYLDSGKNEVRTLPLRNGLATFEHTEEKKDSIEGDEFCYEVISEMVVSTSRQHLSIYASSEKKTDNGKEKVSSYVQFPFAPGEYKFSENYPFSKNINLSEEVGYSFGCLSVSEDNKILYLGELFTITDEMAEKKEPIRIVKELDDETITIIIFATPKAF